MASLLAKHIVLGTSHLTRTMSTLPAIYQWAEKDGEYHRQVSSFRDSISQEPGARFPPESQRYHLYVSYACPWAHRTLLVRAFKQLEDIISVSVVHPYMGADGWTFASEKDFEGCKPDFVNNKSRLSEIYFHACPDYKGRFTVPVLWDKNKGTIVNNESSEIIRMFNSEFDALLPESVRGITYYPENLREEIDATNAWVYDTINNGVYKTGFASAQAVYETHCRNVFASLDRVEGILKENKWLVGNQLTEADIRLFTTILRFDPVYHGHFKCNIKSIAHDYPNILRWARRFYQLDRGKHFPLVCHDLVVADTCNMLHIKTHYYTSHKQINPNGIIPLSNGPNLAHPVDE